MVALEDVALFSEDCSPYPQIANFILATSSSWEESISVLAKQESNFYVRIIQGSFQDVREDPV